MQNKKTYCAKSSFTAILAALTFATLGLQNATAGPAPLFDASWTQIASEDSVRADGFVDPGWGGQLFDAEYLYFKLQGSTLSVGLQTGFDLVDGRVDYGGRAYYAGDLALSFDNNPSAYEYAFDFGLLTKDYSGKLVGDSDGINDAGLYAVTTWNNNIAYPVASPFAMAAGTRIAAAGGSTSAGQHNDSYWRIVSFDISPIMTSIGGDLLTFDAHWTMSCGNDFINGGADVPVPEPATMMLFGTGLAGLAAIYRRKYPAA
ncbi:MAG: PEP-CTERM sorting domain-containing protein [Thermodesulfobacteriota bacterium]